MLFEINKLTFIKLTNKALGSYMFNYFFAGDVTRDVVFLTVFAVPCLQEINCPYHKQVCSPSFFLLFSPSIVFIFIFFF